MSNFARDTEHTWAETTKIPEFNSNFLIHNGEGALPWYASSGTYILSSILGLSWLARMKFMGNT